MDQATLVIPAVTAAQAALALLDAAQIRQIVAALAVFPEYGDWRLILSSPSLDQAHLLKAHDKVAEILHGHFDYALPPIMIFPAKDRFIRGLCGVFENLKTSGGTMQVGGLAYLGGQTIGNRFVSEICVLRLPGRVGLRSTAMTA